MSTAGAAIDAAQSQATSTLDAADQAYNSAEQAAWDSYTAAEAGAWSTFVTTESNAWNAYLSQMSSINADLSAGLANAQARYNSDTSNALATWNTTETNAWNTYLTAIGNAPPGARLGAPTIPNAPAPPITSLDSNTRLTFTSLAAQRADSRAAIANLQAGVTVLRSLRTAAGTLWANRTLDISRIPRPRDVSPRDWPAQIEYWLQTDSQLKGYKNIMNTLDAGIALLQGQIRQLLQP